MFYKLLGMLVWNGTKWYLNRRVGPKVGVKALVAGGALAAGVAAAAVLAKRD
jgi:hypothetical protein